MVFDPEREAAYLEQMFEWQRSRLRWLVLLAPVLLVLFIALQSLLMRTPVMVWLRQPALYVYLVILLWLALWMRTLTRATTFAWAGVALQTAFCLACAFRPGYHVRRDSQRRASPSRCFGAAARQISSAARRGSIARSC